MLLNQTCFQAAQSQNFPLKTHDIIYEDPFDNVDGSYRRADVAEKLVISGGVFSLKNRRRSETLLRLTAVDVFFFFITVLQHFFASPWRSR